jgi:hypothetical protein
LSEPDPDIHPDLLKKDVGAGAAVIFVGLTGSGIGVLLGWGSWAISRHI